MVINSKFILCIRTACILMCQNGGTLDPDSCTCDCLPEFSGDVCESEFIRRGIHIDQKGETFSWEESLQGIEFGIDRINNFLSNCQAESHSIRSPNLCSFSLFCWCILFALCTIHKQIQSNIFQHSTLVCFSGLIVCQLQLNQKFTCLSLGIHSSCHSCTFCTPESN